MIKKALLAVSFGTSIPEAEKCISAVEKVFADAAPDYELVRAFTSRIICRKLAREGRPVSTPEDALDRLLAEGYTDVIVQPTHFMPGNEYDKLMGIVKKYEGSFSSFRIGSPLISSFEDLTALAQVLIKGRTDASDALLFMGHGTEHISNMVYPALQTALRMAGDTGIFIGTVEGWPALSDCISELKACGARSVHLAPLMLVAGDHALNDMSGDEEDSWKCVLAKEGFAVTYSLTGLGLREDVQALYRAHFEALLHDPEEKEA